MGVSVALGLLGAFFLSRAITRVLRATTDSLTAGAEQIAAAANQVSGSSQHLAEGASEQAASLEETSATMEEMSGMTKRTAQSANNAKEIAQAARRAADQSATAVSKLNGSMVELKASSSEVAKIVKTIDEIAFQTNILALNAAVEAARAGEAGAGFAVVAEEVRSLAHRCALAAKETAQKIEDALHKTDDGSRISTEVSVSLGGIIELVRKLDGHIVEIATASSEQAQGIEQVNTAVSQMDKLTQSNAAAAEESASAAEEMSAQARQNLKTGATKSP
jgi:methyl-accepting chemotaxis protein